MFLTEDEIIDDIISSLSEESKAEIKKTAKTDLILFHHGFGTYVRNTYKLWQDGNPLTMASYSPKLVDGVDESEFHPDSVSFRIIERVWERLNVRSGSAE